jgi:hypothetical protein
MAKLYVNVDAYGSAKWPWLVVLLCLGTISVTSGIYASNGSLRSAQSPLPLAIATNLGIFFMNILPFGKITHALPYDRRRLYASRIVVIAVTGGAFMRRASSSSP